MARGYQNNGMRQIADALKKQAKKALEASARNAEIKKGIRQLGKSFTAIRSLASTIFGGKKYGGRKSRQQSAVKAIGGIVANVVADSLADDRRANLEDALNTVREFADDPKVLEALQRILEGAGAQVTWPTGVTSPAEARGAGIIGPGSPSGPGGRGGIGSGEDEPPGAGSAGGSGGGGSGGSRVNMGNEAGEPPRYRNFPPDHPIVTGEMVDCRSSNVHSYGYDIQVHTLYVRYLNQDENSNARHGPGPIYAYYNCPPQLFLKFLKAPSKGKFVWDSLRIRGTVSGHQLDYNLVGVQTRHNGTEVYVPRKATYTASGEYFIPRAVYTNDGTVSRSRYGRQRATPFAAGRPNRGRPNRGNDGRPNNGRP